MVNLLTGKLSGVSNINVTGPSFCMLTCISAPNIPSEIKTVLHHSKPPSKITLSHLQTPYHTSAADVFGQNCGKKERLLIFNPFPHIDAF